jgi:hypothetical protein
VSVQTLRAIVSVVLVAHGLGHALTALPLFGVKLSGTQSADSWLLARLLGPGPARGSCLVLHSLALLGFVGAGLALSEWGLPWGSWERWALWASGLSLLGLGLFWNAFPFLVPNKVGVLAVDLLTLSSILMLRWPAGLFQGPG